MLWGVFLRVTLVNSATHLWGKTRFETGDGRNSCWIALLTFGEAWTTTITFIQVLSS